MPADGAAWDSFADKLNAHHQWPCDFVFKCVVPSAQTEAARALLTEGATTSRESKSGKHVSLTCVFRAADSAAVLAVYRRLSMVPGILLL